MTLNGWAVSAVCGIGMFLFLMPTAGSLAANDKPPENTGTAEETSKLAAAAGKYDIAGMKLGTPFKEAMQALKGHNPKLQMKKDTIKYDVLQGNCCMGSRL